MPANSLETWANFFITSDEVSAALAALVILLVSAREIVTEHVKDKRRVGELVIGLPGGPLSVVAFLAGLGGLWFGHAEGLYWIAAGVVAALLFAILNAWVFPIEVLR